MINLLLGVVCMSLAQPFDFLFWVGLLACIHYGAEACIKNKLATPEPE